ncbi:hypothetical protein INT43_006895 [Umbelopsis isabellina]|uniref:Uncharacterized protein n=1 Tax=Mortierella isabellina TaxID=91625 RepID=A0A8H7UGA5_MORIS|nr:hypothetical protein INT43_006895 [Umbelopsis isabellina]
MAGANLKICLGHDSSHYQMDCLESTGIAASVLLLGLRTVNVSPYPSQQPRSTPDPSPTFTHITEIFDVDGVDELPPFTNHYPGYISDKYDGIRRQLDIDDIRIADANLAGRSNRTGRLQPGAGLWSGGSMLASADTPVNSMSAPRLGPPTAEAQDLLLWFKRQPIISQLHRLLNDVSNMWFRLNQNVVSESADNYDIVIKLQLNCIPEKEEMETTNRAVIEDPALSEVSDDWSPSSTTRFTRECVESIPDYSALIEAEQALALHQTANRQYEYLTQACLDRYIRLGLFTPQPEETVKDQWNRLWRQVNMSLTLRGYDPRSVHLTCCWCGKCQRKPLCKTLTNGSSLSEVCLHQPVAPASSTHLDYLWGTASVTGKLPYDQYIGISPRNDPDEKHQRSYAQANVDTTIV